MAHWMLDHSDLESKRQKFEDAVFNTSPLTLSEIRDIIKKAKYGKSPGPDDITYDLLKHMDDERLNTVKNIINEWWDHRRNPGRSHTSKCGLNLQKRGSGQPRKLQTNKPP